MTAGSSTASPPTSWRSRATPRWSGSRAPMTSTRRTATAGSAPRPTSRTGFATSRSCVPRLGACVLGEDEEELVALAHEPLRLDGGGRDEFPPLRGRRVQPLLERIGVQRATPEHRVLRRDDLVSLHPVQFGPPPAPSCPQRRPTKRTCAGSMRRQKSSSWQPAANAPAGRRGSREANARSAATNGSDVPQLSQTAVRDRRPVAA